MLHFNIHYVSTKVLNAILANSFILSRIYAILIFGVLRLLKVSKCLLYGSPLTQFDRDRSYCSKKDYYPAVRTGSSNTRFFPQFFLFFLVITCPSSWFLLSQTDIGCKLPLNISIVRSFTVASPKFS